MNKKIITIASILKPLKDPRHYERFALSLAKTNKYEINIIANDEKKPDEGNIRFHSNGAPGRNIWQRTGLQWKTWKKIIELKPDVLIICAVELLPIIPIYRAIYKTKIIYDIQENYVANFRYLKEYGWVHKYLLSRMVRLTERLSNLFIDHYFLAEKCYADELHFIDQKYTILENKTALISPVIRGSKIMKSPVKLLFSGTISAYAGIHRVIKLIDKLSEDKIDFELTIIGQCFSKKVELGLKEIESERIRLIIDSRPIPHTQIIREIMRSDIGIIAYESNHVNKNKVPSKLYEYTTYRLPYLVQKETHWANVGADLGGAIEIDFRSISTEMIIKKALMYQDVSAWRVQQTSIWEEEDKKLISLIDTLL